MEREPEATSVEERDADELRRTQEAQRAHGGSMAPGQVDAVGNPVADQPPTAAAEDRH